jgi:hypothetical protein
MGRASRTMARSALAAVAVMVMALGAFLGTTEPGLAATVSHTAEQGANAGTATARLSSAAVSDKICHVSGIDKPASLYCESTNRFLVVDTVNNGDTEDCTFTWEMYWGDGTKEKVTWNGGPADERLIFKASHTYREPRESKQYHVDAFGLSATGGCDIGSNTYYFTLHVKGSF